MTNHADPNKICSYSQFDLGIHCLLGLYFQIDWVNMTMPNIKRMRKQNRSLPDRLGPVV